MVKKHKIDSAAAGNMLNERLPVYESREALEEARLREAVNRTPTQKFLFLMTLMKMSRQMRNATIHYKNEGL